MKLSYDYKFDTDGFTLETDEQQTLNEKIVTANAQAIVSFLSMSCVFVAGIAFGLLLANTF